MIDLFRRAPLRITDPDAPSALVGLIARLDDLVYAAEPIGSRVTCDPAPQDTDIDWLLLIRDPTKDDASAADLLSQNAYDVLKAAGFSQDGQPEFYTGTNRGEFRSWRLGDLNVVTTPDGEFYRRFITATHLAKRFNLLDKADRIALFQVVLYDVAIEMLQESVPATGTDPIPSESVR